MSDIKTCEPIITKEKTEDGWVTTADFGKQGVTTAHVHIAHSTKEKVVKNRKELTRVLNKFGYELVNKD